jgi:hypothetical protein
MKKKFLSLTATITISLALSLVACSKENKPTPEPPTTNKSWIKYYSNITLGDQNNYTIGHFLKTQTGQVVPIEQAYSEQGYMSIMFFQQYGGGKTLTFPGNAWDALNFKDDTINNPNRLIYQPNLGTNFWEVGNKNSGEITIAATSDKYMSSSEFNTIANNLSWQDFDKTFKSFNSGNAHLSYVQNNTSPANGDIYMIELNNEIRGFILVKNVASGAAGGSINFDIIIEGGAEYTNNPTLNRVQPPSKD